MQIRFTSSLTSEDENAVAGPLLRAASAILDSLPIAYSLRIVTADSQVYQHSHPRQHHPPDGSSPDDADGDVSS